MKNLQILILENGVSPMSFLKKHLKIRHLTPTSDVFLHLTLPFDAAESPWVKRILNKKVHSLSLSGVFSDPSLSFLDFPHPTGEKEGFLLYMALLPRLANMMRSLLFPGGGQSVFLDCEQPDVLFPFILPYFHRVFLRCAPEKEQHLYQTMLESFGVPPLFCDTPENADFYISDRYLTGSHRHHAAVLAFAGHFPHADRTIDHRRILLRPQGELKEKLPVFIKELPLSEAAAVLEAAPQFSSADYLPRLLFGGTIAMP